MTKQAPRAASLLAVLLFCFPHGSLAQIVVDGSVGSSGRVEVALEGGVYHLTEQLAEALPDPANPSSLFFGFEQFDVQIDQEARFSGPPSVGLVVARVVGNPASIRGKLSSSIDGANLYILSPAGIDIGENATFDVLGSLHLTTADVLRFTDGTTFSAVAAVPPGPLSVAAPSAFGFLPAEEGGIGTRSELDAFGASGLSVPDGDTLSLVAGVLDLRSSSESLIDAPGARVQLAAVSQPVDVPVDLAALDVTTLADDTLGLVALSNRVNVGGDPIDPARAGSVIIRGNRFLLGALARIDAQNHGTEAPDARAVDIAVQGDATLWGTIRSENRGSAPGSDIEIRARNIEVTRQTARVAPGRIQSVSDAPRNAPRITLYASEGVRIGDGGSVRSGENVGVGIDRAGGDVDIRADTFVAEGGDLSSPTIAISAAEGSLDPAGTARISARVVEVRDDASIVSVTENEGSGGSIEIHASELVDLGNGGTIRTDAILGATGTPGRIEITADQIRIGAPSTAQSTGIGSVVARDTPTRGGDVWLGARSIEIRDGGQIFAQTEGAAPAGDIYIEASERVLVEGRTQSGTPPEPSSIQSRALEAATGTAKTERATISILTPTLEILDGAQVSGTTFGPGLGADVTIPDSRLVRVEGGPHGFSRLSAGAALRSGAVDPADLGAGGDVFVDSDVLEVTDGGQVSISTGGAGDAGRLEVIADEVAVLGNDAGIFAQVLAGATGRGGVIDLDVHGELRLGEGARISSSSLGSGDAGNIELAVGGLQASGGEISTVGLSANGGRIALGFGSRASLTNTPIQSDVPSGGGGGGDITIAGPELILDASPISATATNGQGGSISISVQRLIQSFDSPITADSQRGIDGQINIDAAESDLASELAILEADPVDAEALLGTACSERDRESSRFTVYRRPALPQDPDDPLGWEPPAAGDECMRPAPD